MENIKPLHIEELKDTFLNLAIPASNRNDNIIDYIMQMYECNYSEQKVKINKVIILENYDFMIFLKNLLSGYDFLTEGGTNSNYEVPPQYTDENDFLKPTFYSTLGFEEWKKQSFRVGQLIADETGKSIFVDTQGYNYARYCGLFTGENHFKINQKIKTPKTDRFMSDKRKADQQEAEELEQAYYRAYCD